jgi:hypothetical protein
MVVAISPGCPLTAAAARNIADMTSAAARADRGNREWNGCGSIALTNN